MNGHTIQLDTRHAATGVYILACSCGWEMRYTEEKRALAAVVTEAHLFETTPVAAGGR